MPFVRAAGPHHRLTQRLMSTDYLRSNVLLDSHHLREKGYYRSPYFDASHLLPKYEDFSWTNKFPLEKLCIAELGLKDVFRKGKFVREDYRDIACIPLPGVSATKISARHPDDQYTKAARSMYKNHPRTPLVIPSIPPA